MANRKLHYLALVGIIALGAILRFWHLDLKPLWMDEVITTLFSLGRSYNDIPLEEIFSLNRLEPIFTLKPAVSCSQIARNLATQSNHPPLFFCLMHNWVEAPLMGVMAHNWVWMLRSLPALFGVSAIAAIYWLNAKAFSPVAGLLGAAVMAVSPFAVYLSQEARHYTLPLLLVTLALLGLIQIQQDLFQRKQLRASVCLGWAIVNSIGLYVHYFFILAFIAELVTLFALMYWSRVSHKSWVMVGLAVIAVVVSFLPWLPMMLSQFTRSDSWLPQPNNIAPLFQTLTSWVLMVIALPLENQPLWIAIPFGLVMVLFSIWTAWHVFRGLKQLWRTPKTHLSTLTLGSFILCVLLEFFAIVYLLGKDITVAPRYSFVYYPGICALIGASLGRELENKMLKNYQRKLWLFFAFSALSSILVVSNLVFQKPFEPQQVAQKMNQEPAVPLMVIMGYKDYQDVALGLSFALALNKERSDSTSKFAFFKPLPGYDFIWEKLSRLPSPATSKLNLWVVAPGLRRRHYPHHLALSDQLSCTLDPTQHYRIGVPYQLYRCQKEY